MGRIRRKVTELGRAGLDLVVSEVDALLADFGASGRGLLKALLLFGIAAATGFWAVGVMTYLLIQVAALWLPPWAAAGVVLLLLLLVAFVLYLVGRRVIAGLETPASTVRRHVRDHVDWWQDEILADGRRLPAAGRDEEEDEP